MEDHRFWRIFIILSTVAHISLFPLLYRAAGKHMQVILITIKKVVAPCAVMVVSCPLGPLVQCQCRPSSACRGQGGGIGFSVC